jgi:uncharacterized protein YecE (DUF72 family)
MMGEILVGTAGWTDKSLVDSGLFYPPQVKSPEERLRFYASNFPLVEVDSSYYGMPAQPAAQLWAERTPAEFQFNVKAYRIFTGHQTPPASIPRDIREQIDLGGKKNVYYKDLPQEIREELWKRFREGLQPLREAGKLVAIHFQFAPWMAFHPENFAHIAECKRQIPEEMLAIEFRNKSWFTEKHTRRTLDFLREHQMVNVIVDEPQGFASSVPPVWEVTNPELALVRLHGRNQETWTKKGLKASSERFNYDYSEQELQSVAESVQRVAGQARRTHVILNNNYQDQGQRNGKTLMRLLDQGSQ